MTSQRLTSLDALRGFTIAAMILVNFPGDEAHVFAPLRHTVWNGLTPTDLIAPFFLFIVGISIVLAYGRKVALGEPKGELYRKIVIRFLKLFALGILLNLLPYFNFSDLRYTGVLPRIALVFLPCAFLFLKTTARTQAIVGMGILIAYCLCMLLIPTPGQGKVMLEPGVNLAAWVDLQWLPGKMWQGTWDPEGILSTFPAIVSGISGLLAGHWLQSAREPKDKVIGLMVAGLVSAAAGYVWGLVFPVNENLWTSSFVLVTSGFAALLLGAAYYVVDLRGWTNGTKIGIIFGANAIAVYVMAELLALVCYVFPLQGETLNHRVVNALVDAGVRAEWASALYAVCFVALNFLPAYVLYRRKIFIKL
ncbi:acyltransferase family protein [Chryseolinea lacunae]|uniref:DUF1624 domain-containing protein n=1 Tax=Chryseolinea lacunae TaxID=2801331 RepID=A0ABS1KLU0_9BACT|nr:heparan-alpha-glucosaminide N-acetyltransferase domain-containing protein [Chryseolinea lacunae]MBL0739657.1 DUF1624 domain-containing protein [Chryseolinea lacunae]